MYIFSSADKSLSLLLSLYFPFSKELFETPTLYQTALQRERERERKRERKRERSALYLNKKVSLSLFSSFLSFPFLVDSVGLDIPNDKEIVKPQQTIIFSDSYQLLNFTNYLYWPPVKSVGRRIRVPTTNCFVKD